jgi:peptidoglycan hydrolase-like protein with peptidoglycan-binding domain
MRRRAFAAASFVLVMGSGARAADAPLDAVVKQAGVLQGQVKPLRASNDAPDLAKQLSLLDDDLDALARADQSQAAAVKPVREESFALLADVRKAGAPLGEKFCRDAAEKLAKIALDASGLANHGVPDLPPGYEVGSFLPPAPADAGALPAGLQTASGRALVRLASSEHPNFDSAFPAETAFAAPAAAPRLQARAPLSRPLSAAQDVPGRAKPAFSAQVVAEQEALDAVRRAAHQKPIAVDGLFGAATDKAVKDFQTKNGLAPSGVVDGETQSALLSRFQALAKIPVTGTLDDATKAALAKSRSGAGRTAPVKDFYAGSASDFEATSQQTVIKNALTTIYTPYTARTREQRRVEGPPTDRFLQPICTLEKYLGGSCPYVSVAIDRRLKVPDGTPLLIPQISDLVGRTVEFRIVDTGALWAFHGTKHVDIATDSGDAAGLGSLISGLRLTLILPQGLRPSLR